MFAVGVLYLLFEKSILADAEASRDELSEPRADGLSRLIIGVQVGLVALAMIVTKSSVWYIQAREGLPTGTKYIGWITLGMYFTLPIATVPRLIFVVASLFMPILHGLQPNNHYLHRLVVIFLQFAPSFIILTISYEGLFYFAFCLCLFSWMRLEHHVYVYQSSRTPQTQAPKDNSSLPEAASLLKPAIGAAAERMEKLGRGDYRALTLSDTRISLFFLFFLQSAFFSTGNVASVSSFSLDAVYRLIPVFDPFSQGALLVLKILVPFAVMSANFGILNRRLGVAPSALFMVVMAVSDVMTLSFFYMVKDEGSWLDIGTTISHFVIASLLGVFVAGLELVSGSLVGNVEFRDVKEKVRRVREEVTEKVSDVLEKEKARIVGAASEVTDGNGKLAGT
jgi:phosphatidylinositol glycan class N